MIIKESFGITTPDYFAITSLSECFDVDGIDDVSDYSETLKAMKMIGISPQEQNGNVLF